MLTSHLWSLKEVNVETAVLITLDYKQVVNTKDRVLYYGSPPPIFTDSEDCLHTTPEIKAELKEAEIFKVSLNNEDALDFAKQELGVSKTYFVALPEDVYTLLAPIFSSKLGESAIDAAFYKHELHRSEAVVRDLKERDYKRRLIPWYMRVYRALLNK
jgi:hypothetical protein